MLRKRPLVSRWYYLGCPLRYLKTVLIFPWIYCILEKADGLHHHGWIHFPGGSARGENVWFFCLFCFVCVFLSFHNRWMLNALRPRRIYAPLGLNELKILIIIFFFIARYIPLLCTCTGGVCIHFYRSIHIFVYYIAILLLVTITPQNTTYWTLSCLAIYSNLKSLTNFLFCIIQKRAIKFWGEHFSIRTITPSRHGNVTKAIIKHFRLILNLYIKFAKGKIIWYPGRC